MIPLFVVALLGGLVGIAVTRLVELISRRRSLLDIPTGRSLHVIPTPRLGGLGIVAGTLVGWLAAEGWSDPQGSVVLGAAVALGAVGLLDDVGRVSVLGKYLAQLGAAAIVVAVLSPTLRLEVLSVAVVIDGVPAAVLTAIGLTAVINAFNFMDGIDGLIGMVSVIVGLVAVGIVSPAVLPVVIPVTAATAGFLVWNHAPASIFMGDSGSQFLGLVMGTALLRQPGETIEVAPVLLLVSPLLFDTGTTLVRRARAGRDLFAAHREHAYQRLVIAGRSHREVAAGYAGATAIAGVVALGWTGASPIGQAAVLMTGAMVGIGCLRWVTAVERSATRTVTDVPYGQARPDLSDRARRRSPPRRTCRARR